MTKIVLTAIVVAGMFIFIPAIFDIATYILIGVGLVAIARMLVRIEN